MKRFTIWLSLLIFFLTVANSANSFEVGECFTVVDCQDIIPQPKFYQQIEEGTNDVYLITFFPEDVEVVTVYWGDRLHTTSLEGYTPLVWSHHYPYSNYRYNARITITYDTGATITHTIQDNNELIFDLRE